MIFDSLPRILIKTLRIVKALQNRCRQHKRLNYRTALHTHSHVTNAQTPSDCSNKHISIVSVFVSCIYNKACIAAKQL